MSDRSEVECAALQLAFEAWWEKSFAEVFAGATERERNVLKSMAESAYISGANYGISICSTMYDEIRKGKKGT